MSRPPVFIGLNKVKVLVLLLPHMEGIFALVCPDWACYLREAPFTTGWWDPAVCHEPYDNVNSPGCDPLSTSEP
jgi:hypothetical protein